MPFEPPVTSPASLAEAHALLQEGDWTPIAGGTDLMVRITGEIGQPPKRLLNIWHIDALRGIDLTPDGSLVMGALSTWTELRRSSLILRHLPVLAEAAATIGATQIQNRGTIGGNVVNASPAGDSLPVLLAVDATFLLGSTRGERMVTATDFWTGYRTTDLKPDELLLRIDVPLPGGRRVRFRKVGTRRAQAISKVIMAVSWRADGDVWRDVRVALGSLAATPVRIPVVEAILEGAPANEVTAELAASAISAAISPIDDVRSTADYRREVTGRILHRLLRGEGGW